MVEPVHDNFAIWSIILTALSIALSLPLGLAGSLLAPKVQDWWARRSKKTLVVHIQELEDKLEELKKAEPLTPNERKILETLEELILIVGAIIVFLVVIVYQATRLPFVSNPPPPFNPIKAFIAAVAVSSPMVLFMLRLRRWRTEQTVEYRNQLKLQIEKLRGEYSGRVIDLDEED
jgi:hypothetical protein